MLDEIAPRENYFSTNECPGLFKQHRHHWGKKIKRARKGKRKKIRRICCSKIGSIVNFITILIRAFHKHKHRLFEE